MDIINNYNQYISGKRDESFVYLSIVSWAEKNKIPQQEIEQHLKPYFPIFVMAVENKEQNILCVWRKKKMDYELKILLCKGNHNDIKNEAYINGLDINDADCLKFNNILLQSSGVPIITKIE